MKNKTLLKWLCLGLTTAILSGCSALQWDFDPDSESTEWRCYKIHRLIPWDRGKYTTHLCGPKAFITRMSLNMVGLVRSPLLPVVLLMVLFPGVIFVAIFPRNDYLIQARDAPLLAEKCKEAQFRELPRNCLIGYMFLTIPQARSRSIRSITQETG